jgi:AraC-like DNA-binding protein
VIPVTADPLRFSTVGLPEDQRIALWEDHNAHALIAVRCRSLQDATLEATEINVALPRLQLARVLGNPHVVERTGQTVRQTPSDAVACYFTLAGEAFFYHDDGVRTVSPGQVIVCDADRPFMRGFSHGLEELAVKVPRQVFEELSGTTAPTEPLVLDFARGDVQARTLARLVGRAVRADAAVPVDESTVLDLLGGFVSGRAADLATAHLAAAKTYIEEWLADPGLSASQVACGIGISERHLSRVFATGGTSMPRYILNRRLDRAHRLLTEGPQLGVAEVAYRCGFSSPARFSHAFKERFGLRATDLRHRARARLIS